MKILKFYADCCASCKHQGDILKNLEIEVVPVNCEEELEMVSKYEIRTVPTLVLLDNEDNVIKKFSGFTNLETIQKEIWQHQQQ